MNSSKLTKDIFDFVIFTLNQFIFINKLILNEIFSRFCHKFGKKIDF